MSCLILLELVLAAAPVSASYRPTPAQEKEITKHIVQGLTAAQALKEDPTILGARSLKRDLEAQMGLPLEANGDAMRAPTEEELRRLKGFWRDRRGDYAAAAKVVGDAIYARDHNLNRAIELSVAYYQINGPVRQSGVVRYNADPPNLGNQWQWRLRFSEIKPPGEPDESWAWITPQDGTVNVLIDAFSSPAMLAFNILHEARHYQLALADSEYRMFRSDEEVWISRSNLRYVEDLGLSKDEVRFIMRNTAGQHVIALAERRRAAQGLSPKTPHGGFGLTITDAGMAETVAAVDADLAAFDGVLARGVTEEELEALKAGAHSEFVRDSNRSELLDLIAAWRSARENDAAQAGREALLRQEQAEEAARVRVNQLAEAAGACGFQVTPEGYYSINGYLPFRIMHGGDVDKARAAFLLHNACRRQGYPDAEPCNDAIGVVSSRWNEAGFRDSMLKIRTTDPFPDGESEEGQCLLDLRDRWAPRGTFADLKGTIEKNYVRRRAAQTPRRPPEPPREPRPPREPAPPPRGGGQCYRSNDGREICP